MCNFNEINIESVIFSWNDQIAKNICEQQIRGNIYVLHCHSNPTNRIQIPRKKRNDIKCEKKTFTYLAIRPFHQSEICHQYAIRLIHVNDTLMLATQPPTKSEQSNVMTSICWNSAVG